MKMRQKDSTRIIYHELNIVIDIRKMDIFHENVIILVVLVEWNRTSYKELFIIIH